MLAIGFPRPISLSLSLPLSPSLYRSLCPCNCLVCTCFHLRRCSPTPYPFSSPLFLSPSHTPSSGAWLASLMMEMVWASGSRGRGQGRELQARCCKPPDPTRPRPRPRLPHAFRLWHKTANAPPYTCSSSQRHTYCCAFITLHPRAGPCSAVLSCSCGIQR